MDRRLFLTGLLGLAGAATLAKVAGPSAAEAGVMNANGILDELAASQPEVTNVDHRPGHRRRRPDRRHWRRDHYRGDFHRPRRPRRRPWREVCERYRRHGRWYRRCWREPVWM